MVRCGDCTDRQIGERSAPGVTGTLDGETERVARHPPRHNTDSWPASKDQEDNWSYYTLDQTDGVNRKHYPGLFLHICHHLALLIFFRLYIFTEKVLRLILF